MRTDTMPAGLGRVALLLAVLPWLQGCSVLSISGLPLWELAKAAGGLTVESLEREVGPPTQVLRHEPLDLAQLCIEFNPYTPTSDFVPALQTALQRNGVRSRVYEPGTSPQLCPIWLQYTAQLDWDTRALSSERLAYLSLVEITLRNTSGRVMATGQYRYEPGRLRDGKWASTPDKLDALVTALVAKPKVQE